MTNAVCTQALALLEQGLCDQGHQHPGKVWGGVPGPGVAPLVQQLIQAVGTGAWCGLGVQVEVEDGLGMQQASRLCGGVGRW